MLKTFNLQDVQTQAVSWCWYPYIPAAKITIVQGDPGEGKTTMVLSVAAAITTGTALPNGSSTEPANVIFQTAEDGYADTIRPRLEMFGANLARVHVIDEDEQPLTLTDVRIEEAIIRFDAKLLVLDPLQAYLGGRNMNSANGVRPMMKALGAVAERTGCAIVIIGHLNKSGSKAQYRGLGSTDIPAAARSVLTVGRIDEHTRAFVQTKSNLAPAGKPQAFKLDPTAGFMWLGDIAITAEELLSGMQDNRPESQLEKAMRLIRAILQDGAELAEVVVSSVEAEGVSYETTKRAKKALSVRSFKRGERWYWELPTGNDDPDDGLDDGQEGQAVQDGQQVHSDASTSETVNQMNALTPLNHMDMSASADLSPVSGMTEETPATEPMQVLIGRAASNPNPPIVTVSGKYDVILADPPWAYSGYPQAKNRKPEAHYPTLPIEDIKAMSIPAEDNSVLYLWATAPLLPEALDVMKAWGFTYKSQMIWDKDVIGMGYWSRGQHELLLIGTKGKFSPPIPELRETSVYCEKRTKHSKKPDYFNAMLEKQHPDGKFLELFARRQYSDKWTVWGNEVTSSPTVVTEPVSVLLEQPTGRVAIIDADLADRGTPTFPNLVCEKYSSYCIQRGCTVELKLDYENLETYDIVFISKVFTKTPVPADVLTLPNVKYGGTGFYDDKAPPLPYDIEHTKPDYNLYADWVKSMLIITDEKTGKPKYNKKDFQYYTDYSIGYLSRGCIRKCGFCVNRNKHSSDDHASVHEFLDESRPKICLLDDNFFACKSWRQRIEEVKATGKKFVFKQGLDIRLFTDEHIHEIMTWSKYINAFYFAFDSIANKDLIEKKLKRIYELYPNCTVKFISYVLCGYDRSDVYDADFWLQDIVDTFERIYILAKYAAYPYIMRYDKTYDNPYTGLYSVIASWCNQLRPFRKIAFATYAQRKGMSKKNFEKYGLDFERYLAEGGKKGATWRYIDDFSADYPEVADKFFHLRPESVMEFGFGKPHFNDVATKDVVRLGRQQTLRAASVNNKDEFYTQLSDIELELAHYTTHFVGKHVYCNCDNPYESNFVRYFVENFERLGLAKLTATCFFDDETQYNNFGDETVMCTPSKVVFTGISDAVDFETTLQNAEVTELQGDGDFRSPECLAILEEADIVVTNPPFSLFKQFTELMDSFDKQYIVIGNTNALIFNNVFDMFKAGKLSTGYTNFNKGMYFRVPDDYAVFTKEVDGVKYAQVVASCWYTNLAQFRKQKFLELTQSYDPQLYPTYHNYNAINVDKVKDIPYDYDGFMGVPITFLSQFNPNQFELYGILCGTQYSDIQPTREYENAFQVNADGVSKRKFNLNINPLLYVSDKPTGTHYTADGVDGYLVSKYARVQIKRKL